MKEKRAIAKRRKKIYLILANRVMEQSQIIYDLSLKIKFSIIIIDYFQNKKEDTKQRNETELIWRQLKNATK